MRVELAVAIPILAALACSSPNDRPDATPPPSTSAQRPVVGRFTHDLWPVVSAYNAIHSQGGNTSAAFTAFLAADMSADQYGEVRAAAQALGQMGAFDKTTHTSHYNDGLHLGAVSVTSIHQTTAALAVCYTYTDYRYVVVTSIQHAPAASEATFTLTEQEGMWQLSGISDDHVVPGCNAALNS